MPNKCCAFGCTTGYAKKKKEDPTSGRDDSVPTFHFPIKKQELLSKWVKFVGKKDWTPTSTSVLCDKHFKECYIKRGQRTTLNWDLNPVPTIHTSTAAKRPASFPVITEFRKPPKMRGILPDQKREFDDIDVIESLESIDPSRHCPSGYESKRNNSSLLFYKTVFDGKTGFPSISAGILIDENLHVKLQCNGMAVPLPKWFVEGKQAKLKRFSMLQNLPSYLENHAEEHPSTILEELRSRQNYKPRGRPPFSPELLRYALLLRYSSLQTYRVLLEQFPLPSFSLLKKLHKGGIDSLKAAKILLHDGFISADVILMADEMYLQKSTQYHGGEYVGADDDGNLFSGICVFMVIGLKRSVPIVVRASPETTVNGHWLSRELEACVTDLNRSGFKVRGLVTDNHAANVSAFKILLKNHPGDQNHFFQLPHVDHPTYVFFDNVHLVKNLRNNLLNARKFVFPTIDFDVCGHVISSTPGYVSWKDIHAIYDIDKKLSANLRKAPRLSYRALHPGNDKQNVNLALAIFDEKTIAASRSYFPQRTDMANFLDLIFTWWKISNSNNKYESNQLGNAITKGDGKVEFYEKLSEWIENWCKCPNFVLSKQTANALVLTLRSQSMLIKDLLAEDYEYVLTRRLQSDPIENRFSQYRQMSGGRFLVSLREIKSTEKILICRSLLKAGVDYWNEEEASSDQSETEALENFMSEIELHETELLEASLCDDSAEVAQTIAGYVARKLLKKNKCHECSLQLLKNEEPNANSYLHLLSRGGLLNPSTNLAFVVSSIFAQIEYINSFIKSNSVRKFAQTSLQKYAPDLVASCENHHEINRSTTIKIVTNCFYNNLQKLTADDVRKEAIVGFKKRQRNKD